MKITLFAAVLTATLFAALNGTAAAPEPFDWKSSVSGDELTLTVTVAPDHYFYADNSFRLNISGRDGGKVETLSSPQSQEIDDEFMGKVAIYPAGEWVWKFRGTPPFSGSVRYQGCRKAVDGEPALCFLPKTFERGPVMF